MTISMEGYVLTIVRHEGRLKWKIRERGSVIAAVE